MIRTAGSRYTILTVYFLFICFLFFLPGRAFPRAGNWMAAIYFDKWVHAGIFFWLTYIICWAVSAAKSKTLLFIFIVAVLYGIAVELVQDQFVANRSCDLGDWAADSAGAFAGIWWWNLRYIKK